jgi:hypothetical protein
MVRAPDLWDGDLRYRMVVSIERCPASSLIVGMGTFLAA